jgi:hypothetical protein
MRLATIVEVTPVIWLSQGMEEKRCSKTLNRFHLSARLNLWREFFSGAHDDPEAVSVTL